jgi:rubredoxin
VQVAAEVDQITIATLKIEQTHLISSLKNKDDSIEKKIHRLGEIIEDRFKRNDMSLAKEGIVIYDINQISESITSIFTRMGLKIAPHVPDYCYPRWKDPTKIHKRELDECPAERSKIDQLVGILKSENELLNEIPSMATSDMDISYETILKLKSKYENAARDRHHLLPGHEEKDPKITPKSKPEFSTEWEAIEWLRNVALKKYQDYVYEFPGPSQKQRYWATGWQEFGLLIIDITNLKSSLITTQWLSRIKYMFHQSKHGAAVLDEIETMICDACWDDETGKERPDCNAEMEWDWFSPSKWRCPTCGGTKGKLRGLTREQVGDNKVPVITKAEILVNNLPGIYEALEHRITETDKRIYARKIALAIDLQKKS